MSSLTNVKVPVVTNKFAKEKAEIDFGIGPLKAISQDLVDHLESLTEGVEIDLDAPLPSVEHDYGIIEKDFGTIDGWWD